VVPNFALNKAVPHGFEESCSAMATQKLEEKVQQHDEDAESSKTGCRSPSRAHDRVQEWFRHAQLKGVINFYQISL